MAGVILAVVVLVVAAVIVLLLSGKPHPPPGSHPQGAGPAVPALRIESTAPSPLGPRA